MACSEVRIKGSEDTRGTGVVRRSARTLCSSSRHKVPAPEPVSGELVMTLWRQGGLGG